MVWTCLQSCLQQQKKNESSRGRVRGVSWPPKIWSWDQQSHMTLINKIIFMLCLIIGAPHQIRIAFLVSSSEELEVIRVLLTVLTYKRLLTMRRTNFSAKYITILVMFYHYFYRSAALNSHSLRKGRHARKLSQWSIHDSATIIYSSRSSF